MTRDEALRLQIAENPCFYTGEILKTLKHKRLYIRQLTYPQAKMQAARVSTTLSASINQARVSQGDIDSTWIELDELSGSM